MIAPMDLDAAYRAFLEGRPRARRQLADALRLVVVACLRHRVGSGIIEDVTQETLARVFEGIGEYEDRGPGSLRAWVWGIARNTASEASRRQGRHRRVLDSAWLLWPFIASSVEQLHWREWIDTFRQGLEELDPIYQSALTHIALGRSAAELATLEKVSPRTILTRAKRARDFLRAYLRTQRRSSGRFLSTVTENNWEPITPGGHW